MLDEYQMSSAVFVFGEKRFLVESHHGWYIIAKVTLQHTANSSIAHEYKHIQIEYVEWEKPD